jgi:glutamyl-tRNA synthetase
VRSRLAPSPTGAFHVGNVRTFLLTWLHVRAAGGSLALRVDDLDGPRVKPEATQEGLDDLRWLGLPWDEDLEVLVQSARGAVYAAAAADLVARGLAYPCVCTRREVETAASAPHGPDGPRYPGTCRGRFASAAAAVAATGRPAALRFVVTRGPVAFTDGLFGPQVFDVADETGDFVVFKSNGTAAYQLATVIDDAASGVDLVIRGADLLPSTARQLLLARALGLASPSHLHLPLVVGPDGLRLAKRHGDTSVRALRAAGWSSAGLVGRIASTAGLCGPSDLATPADLLSRYSPSLLTRSPIVLDASFFSRPH